MSWNEAEELAERYSGGASKREKSEGGLFVRMAEDGQRIVGAFVGAPCAYEAIWTGTRYELYDETREEHREERPKLRIAMNFYVPDDGMKVWEMGVTLFRDVKRVREKYGLDKWLFEVERHGVKGDPKTTYSVLPDRQIDEAMAKEIGGAKLIDLDALIVKTMAPGAGDRAGGGSSSSRGGRGGAAAPAPAGSTKLADLFGPRGGK